MLNTKENIIFIIISVLTIIMTVVGLTFAYFSTTMTGNDANVLVTTASIGNVTFNGGSNFTTGVDIMPGWSESKIITVTVDASNFAKSTDINLVYTNSFTDLEYSITLLSATLGGNATSTGYSHTLNSGTLPVASTSSTETVATINTDALNAQLILTYQITMSLPEEAGNTNMGKAFSGTLSASANSSKRYYNTNNPQGGSSIGNY